ncbi:hypothetical protein GCM10007977_102260 [Dactylosporangium sucinum]|uniref:Carboxyvinyl-carboxyphosphonate phosphorylmutase n=1 Tax=Dactylosporangium sucinum TaxID=1424081 RepID=A0A917UD47_9ACTN|nr:hypothetical protein GCM10007977_102260 [Dactylosporangium sucinum]
MIADADTGYGNPLAVRRTVRAWERAGAAALHVEDQTSPKRCGLDEMRTIAEAFRGVVPVLSNQIEGGRTPLPGVAALQDMGYSLAVFSLGTAFAAAEGMRAYLRALANGGTPLAMTGFDEFNALVGLEEHTALEARYAG